MKYFKLYTRSGMKVECKECTVKEIITILAFYELIILVVFIAIYFLFN